MYLVSLYFDDKSESKIQGLINEVAEKSGNNFMIDNNVPPHITIAAFQSDKEERVIQILDNVIKNNSKEKHIKTANLFKFTINLIPSNFIINN